MDSKFTEWLKLSTQQLLWLLLFSSLVLSVLSFAPDSALATFGLRDFRAEYRTWIGLSWLFAFSGLVIWVGRSVYQWAKSKITIRQHIQKMQQRLHNLTPDERDILRGYIADNTRTQNLRTDSGVVNGLVTERILYRSSQIGTLYRIDHNINPLAWDYLKKHPELLVNLKNSRDS